MSADTYSPGGTGGAGAVIPAAFARVVEVPLQAPGGGYEVGAHTWGREFAASLGRLLHLPVRRVAFVEDRRPVSRAVPRSTPVRWDIRVGDHPDSHSVSVISVPAESPAELDRWELVVDAARVRMPQPHPGNTEWELTYRAFTAVADRRRAAAALAAVPGVEHHPGRDRCLRLVDRLALEVRIADALTRGRVLVRRPFGEPGMDCGVAVAIDEPLTCWFVAYQSSPGDSAAPVNRVCLSRLGVGEVEYGVCDYPADHRAHGAAHEAAGDGAGQGVAGDGLVLSGPLAARVEAVIRLVGPWSAGMDLPIAVDADPVEG